MKVDPHLNLVYTLNDSASLEYSTLCQRWGAGEGLYLIWLVWEVTLLTWISQHLHYRLPVSPRTFIVINRQLGVENVKWHYYNKQ